MEIRNQYLKKFIILDKIYENNDKFNNTSNKFSFKGTIFLDKYKQVSLLESVYI